MGEPVEGAQQAMMTLKRRGDTLIIHTARERFKPVEDWLWHFAIPYDQITNIKPNADFFIDDKALRFTTWAQVLQDL